MTKYDKILFFLMSVSPVYIILIVIKIDISSSDNFVNFLSKNIFPSVLLVLFIIAFIFQLIFNHSVKKLGSAAAEYKVLKIKNSNSDFLSFFATYLIPLSSPMENDRYWIVFLITYFIMGYLFIKSNLYYNNIGLIFFGYNLFSVELEIETKDKTKVIEGTLLVKGKKNIPVVDERIKAFRTVEKNEAKNIYILKKRKEED